MPFFFKKMNGGLLLLKKVPPNLLLLLTDYPQGENGLWAPFDLLNCTSSANKDGIPDGWGPNVFLVVTSVFPGLFSPSWSLFQASFFLLLVCLCPFRVTSSCHDFA
jgi:hypothetical protein